MVRVVCWSVMERCNFYSAFLTGRKRSAVSLGVLIADQQSTGESHPYPYMVSASSKIGSDFIFLARLSLPNLTQRMLTQST